MKGGNSSIRQISEPPAMGLSGRGPKQQMYQFGNPSQMTEDNHHRSYCHPAKSPRAQPAPQEALEECSAQHGHGDRLANSAHQDSPRGLSPSTQNGL